MYTVVQKVKTWKLYQTNFSKKIILEYNKDNEILMLKESSCKMGN